MGFGKHKIINMKKLFVTLVILSAMNTNVFSQPAWIEYPIGYPLNSSVKNFYFINSQTGILCGSGGILARTTNGGVNWAKIPNNRYNKYYAISFINNNTGWISGSNYNNYELIKKTTDAGQTWDSLFFDANGSMNDMMFLDNNTGYAAGIYMKKTTNGGLNWFVIDPTSPYQYFHIYFINTMTGWVTKSHYDQFYNVYVSKLQKTTNGGQNWIIQIYDSGTVNKQIEYIKFFDANTGYMSTASNGFRKSTNGGENWVTIYNNAASKFSFININTGWMIYGSGVKRTTNGGYNWQTETITQYLSIFEGLYFINELTGWIGGQQSSSAKLYKTTNGGITSVTNISSEIPAAYSLRQNYPNPFNPSTSIRYELPRAGVVRLAMYDVMGREVEMLVNERQSAGTYEATFNASRLPSGVYFARLETGSYNHVIKMLLLK